ARARASSVSRANDVRKRRAQADSKRTIFAVDLGKAAALGCPFVFRRRLSGAGAGGPQSLGQVAEWSNAHAWKACVGQPTEGSNPSLSATLEGPSDSHSGIFVFGRCEPGRTTTARRISPRRIAFECTRGLSVYGGSPPPEPASI